jgi:hypothetical protein
MAVDATGTPTSPDNIPKFNTAVDAPSGKGSNAQMDAIQTALSAKIPAPVGISANEGVVWNGSTWVRSSTTGTRFNNGGTTLPKVIVSAFSGGPPGSPTDGDIWIATDPQTAGGGQRWQFQFNAGSASIYKWEFIGGAPAYLGPQGSLTTSATGQHDLTGGPTIVQSRDGDYIMGLGITMVSGSGQGESIAQLNGTVNPQFAGGIPILLSTENYYQTAWAYIRANGIAAQTWNITTAIATGTFSVTFSNGCIELIPIRVK